MNAPKIGLRELLLGGPGHDGYIYNADVWCKRCGHDIIHQLWEDMTPETRESLTTDSMEVADSNRWPQPIFFGESDSAEHCCDCGEYLYGPQEESESEEGNDN